MKNSKDANTDKELSQKKASDFSKTQGTKPAGMPTSSRDVSTSTGDNSYRDSRSSGSSKNASDSYKKNESMTQTDGNRSSKVLPTENQDDIDEQRADADVDSDLDVNSSEKQDRRNTRVSPDEFQDKSKKNIKH